MTEEQKIEHQELILKMLDRFEELIENQGMPYNERALWHLLKQHEDVLPVLNGYFHKAFRQVDITPNWHIDMAIWCLLQQSKLFWEIYKELVHDE